MTAHIALSFLQCCLCRILRLAGWAEVSRLYLTCHREKQSQLKDWAFQGMVLSVSHALYHDAVMMPLLQHHRARTYSPGWKRLRSSLSLAEFASTFALLRRFQRQQSWEPRVGSSLIGSDRLVRKQGHRRAYGPSSLLGWLAGATE